MLLIPRNRTGPAVFTKVDRASDAETYSCDASLIDRIAAGLPRRIHEEKQT